MVVKGWKIIVAVATAALGVVLLRGCVATSYLIPSEGMESSLYRGERILVNRWSYGFRVPLMQWWGYHRWAEKPVKQGDIVVFNNPANRQEKAIERREVFISRCIGLPGDTLPVDTLFRAIHTLQNAPDQQFLYSYPRQREAELQELARSLGIEPKKPVGQDSLHCIGRFSRYEHYLLKQALKDTACWIVPIVPDDSLLRPLVVPRKGSVVKVEPWNVALLCNTLVLHEGRRAGVRGDTLYVDGKPVGHCRFTKDYHWVASNNPTNLNDSRLFGFVPKDHIIGKASVVWFSKEQERIGTRVR